jgi:pseudaminic acid biosynthesis-associated methylase
VSASESAKRLEELWAGDFGDAYVERNIGAADGRGDFWGEQLRKLAPESVLEVGCNVGANLHWIAADSGITRVAGVDVNRQALDVAQERVPRAELREATAKQLPFEDGEFELVFTTGVLIHQPPDHLDEVMSEIVRCSSRYVLCGEYYAEELTEIPYRGQEGALFKLDFGGRYQELFPDLQLTDKGFLPRADGVWDDVSYWVFTKPEPSPRPAAGRGGASRPT